MRDFSEIKFDELLPIDSWLEKKTKVGNEGIFKQPKNHRTVVRNNITNNNDNFSFLAQIPAGYLSNATVKVNEIEPYSTRMASEVMGLREVENRDQGLMALTISQLPHNSQMASVSITHSLAHGTHAMCHSSIQPLVHEDLRF